VIESTLQKYYDGDLKRKKLAATLIKYDLTWHSSSWIFLYDNWYWQCRVFSQIPITTDTSNNRADYEYYRCIGTAL